MRRPEILLSPKADLLRFFLGGGSDVGSGTDLGVLGMGVFSVVGSGSVGSGVDGSGVDGFGADGPGIGSSGSLVSPLSDGSLPFEIRSSNSTSET